MSDYANHQSIGMCGCQQCVELREAFAPAPATTAPPAAYRQTGQGKSYQREAERKVPMANINVCDRDGCNAFIKGNAAASVTYETQLNTYDADDTREAKQMILCPACIADVLAVLDSEPVTPREKAYSKPYVRPAAEDSIKAASAEQLAAELFQKLMKQERQREIESS